MLLGMMLAISCLQGFQLLGNTMCRALLWDFVSLQMLAPEWRVRERARETRGEKWYKGHCEQLKEGKGDKKAGEYHKP